MFISRWAKEVALIVKRFKIRWKSHNSILNNRMGSFFLLWSNFITFFFSSSEVEVQSQYISKLTKTCLENVCGLKLLNRKPIKESLFDISTHSNAIPYLVWCSIYTHYTDLLYCTLIACINCSIYFQFEQKYRPKKQIKSK